MENGLRGEEERRVADRVRRGNKKMKTGLKLSFQTRSFSLRAKLSIHVLFADVTSLILSHHLTLHLSKKEKKMILTEFKMINIYRDNLKRLIIVNYRLKFKLLMFAGSINLFKRTYNHKFIYLLQVADLIFFFRLVLYVSLMQ